MKKFFVLSGLMMAAIVSLTNCKKESQTEFVRSEDFKLVLSAPDTKTSNAEMSTLWSEKDAVGVFYRDLDGALKKILESRGDYQALKHAAASQKQEIAAARAGMLPTLSLSSGYRFGYHQSGLSNASKDNQWTASLVLDVPVWDSGSTSGNVRAAKAGLKSAENAVTEKEESIKAEIADNWLGLQNALETLSASRANVGLARESLDFAESGYREGVNTQLDVLQARSDLTSALQQLALSLKNARTAQAALWKSEGVFLENAFRQSRQNAEFIPIGTKKTK